MVLDPVLEQAWTDSVRVVAGERTTEGPLEGLLARSVVVVDENDKVVHAQLVENLGAEPDYDAALASIR